MSMFLKTSEKALLTQCQECFLIGFAPFILLPTGPLLAAV